MVEVRRAQCHRRFGRLSARVIRTLPIVAVAFVMTIPPGWAGSAASGSTIVHTHGQDIAVNPSVRAGMVYKRGYLAAHPTPPRTAADRLPYQGGPIVSGPPKVYLVYWGSQWGTASTGADGYQHYSGDTSGIAPLQQALFSGLGTGGELWSGVMTQYCQGIAVGSYTCPSSATHVGYPTGGALAGVWEDDAAASPSQSTLNQIAAESILAAAHFGNTDASSNANAQYVIVSPTGTNPDDYLNPSSGFCAWHSATGSIYGTLAYTNMPYVSDAGYACWSNSVNTVGPLDGVTLVGGHEYAETITDPNPSDPAWWDLADITSGGENGDKCSGSYASGANLTFTTGTFPMQPTYDNDANSGTGGCSLSQAISGSGGTPITVTGRLSGGYGRAGRLTLYRAFQKVKFACQASPNVAGGENAYFTLAKLIKRRWRTKTRFHYRLDSSSRVGIYWSKYSLSGGSYAIDCSVSSTATHTGDASPWSYFRVVP